MSYEDQLIREATEGPTWQDVHEDYCSEEATPEATIPGIEMKQKPQTKETKQTMTITQQMNANAMAEADRRQSEWNQRHSEAIDHAKRHGFTPEPWATMHANHWQGSIADFERAVRES